jgi:Na+-translocating ferredoxin:NAD+ oxidoreductase RNF subunit RnfB
MSLIQINNERCKKCYACVRICPVQAIKVDINSDYPGIVSDRCIGCGNCVTICQPDAIGFENSCEDVKSLINSGESVIAIIGPSIAGEFSDITDYRKFVEMIRRIGFAYVCEASFGVDLVAQRYAQLFDNNKGKYYITANCPSVCFYIEKYYPELIENLAPIVSPMIAMAKVVRKRYGKTAKVVYVGSCIANKKSALRHNGTDGQVDAVLTFRELRQLFSEFNIKESKLEYSDFDPPFGNNGSLYPISNGLLQASGISEDLLNGNVITTEGRDNMLEAIREFEKHPHIINRHFNLFYDEGCLMGPGTSKGGERFLRRTLVINYAHKRILALNKRVWVKDMKDFQDLDLTTVFTADDQRMATPPEINISEVLRILGKENASDTLGCGACGYSSCHAFAVAVAEGLTRTDMCINYSTQNSQKYIKEINLLQNKIFNAQQALDESQHALQHEQEMAETSAKTIETMIQKMPVNLVITDERLHVTQASQNLIQTLGSEAVEISDVIPGLVGADLKSLVPFGVYHLFSYVLQNGEDILNRDIHLSNGELYNISIFSIVKNKITGAIIRDMQMPEIRKEEVIKRVTDVVDKNLEMVQKIGFLLGEGAAETERMLNSIIEFYKKEK